ncbi:MAG: M18 family aminopeptidase [Lachnospiraceae bacterium]|jgi:aspartyl aminopeptidase
MNGLNEFLLRGVSPFHTVQYCTELLNSAGFMELDIQKDWKLEINGRYYCSPFDSTLYAFTIGESANHGKGIHIAAAHTDWPTLKIKPDPEIRSHGYLQLNTEVYGGPRLSTFFDRPLSIAGRVLLTGERYDEPRSMLVDFEDAAAYLPNLAIHMDRGANEHGQPIDNQKMLRPLLGTLTGSLDENTALCDLIADRIGINVDDILDFDLNLYNKDRPETVGVNREFLSSPRLDDLTSCYALIRGLIEGSDRADNGRVNLVCLFDNEEIGSLTKQGADSIMPLIILNKIWKAFGRDSVQCMSDLNSGLLLSCDVAHAYHPDFPKKQDITSFPVLGGGVCLKTAGNQSYTWDSTALAAVIALCRENDIPYQRFVKHSNVKGGGTIGSVLASRLVMPAVDTGVGLLAMHSSREFMSLADQQALNDLAVQFFSN